MKNLITNLKLTKKHIIIICLALLYWLLTFLFEGNIFIVSNIKNRLLTYLVIKILYFFVLILIFSFIYNLILGFKNKNSTFYITIYAIPFILLVLFLQLIFGQYPFLGDENLIFEESIKYSNMEGFFTYYTTYFYMLSMQLLPFQWSIILFKIILSGLVIGYIIFRFKNLLKTNFVFITYFFTFSGFIIYFILGKFRIDSSISLLFSVHRMPMYAMLYLFCACKLFCDYLEHVKLDRKSFIILSVILSILTQWRVEGIYLALLGIILIIISYRIKLNKKLFLKMYAIFLAIQLILYIPQSLETNLANNNYNNHRLTHFYNYVITNMMRNGLDESKNKAELEIIDKYVSIDKIKEINQTYGDEAYRDEYILFYGGIRENTTEDIMILYEKTMNKIIIKNLDIFIISQLESFNYITFGYDISNIIFSNLYITYFIILISFIFFFFNKNYTGMLLVLCLICHSIITTILLPAAYFKYYYMQYLISILFITYLSCKIFNKLKVKFIKSKNNCL